ncbi:AAA family ATPase [Qipengyuania flava]|uniref:AAA family ATPase n=1 Tax=Qipengyuania flava TaxID=192812 RepID=UPI00273EAFFA|nr:AAA family ATPase [Qipengyuania flava]
MTDVETWVANLERDYDEREWERDESPYPENEPTKPRLLPLIDIAALAQSKPPPREWGIEGLAPLGELSLFPGAGSAGKSLLSQQFATAAAAGLDCVRIPTRKCASLYLTCEDSQDELHRRQLDICDTLSTDLASLADRLHLVSLRGELENTLGKLGENGALVPAPLFDRLADTIRARAIELVFLDNVAHLFAGNENARDEVTKFVNLLNRLARDTGAAIVLLAHPPKPRNPGEVTHAHSGSTAWLNAVRSQFSIEHDLETDFRTLVLGKANYARKGTSTRFIWRSGAFVHEDDLPPDVAASLAETAKANGENSAFLRCLEAATARRKAVSENPGVNYYGTVFPKMPEAKGLHRPAFERAFERLLALGKIELDAKLWQRENRAWKYGIRAVDNPADKCTDPLHRPAAPTRTEPEGGSARTDPPIPKGITGAATRAAAPNEAGGDE